MKDLVKKGIAEMIGTGLLVLVACGVAVVAQNNALGIGGWWVATSLAFGFVLVAMAYSIGNISGCHINPAVSLALFLSKKITGKQFCVYIFSQALGGLLGALLLGICLRGNFEALGGNVIQDMLKNNGKLDAWSYVDAFLIETVLSFIFVITVLGVTDVRCHNEKRAGIVIGLSLAVVHLLGLGFTGTSVNPARSLGPAILEAIAGASTSLSQIWIWILAPLIGAILATIVYKFLTRREIFED